jgi:hypothetical protein
MCEKPKADYKKLNMCITAPRLQRLWWCLLLRAAMLLLATPTTPPGDDYEMHRYGVVFDAGSSGTRVNVYRWSAPPDEESLLAAPSSDAYVRSVMATLIQVGQKKNKNFGISAFAAHIPENGPGGGEGEEKGEEKSRGSLVGARLQHLWRYFRKGRAGSPLPSRISVQSSRASSSASGMATLWAESEAEVGAEGTVEVVARVAMAKYLEPLLRYADEAVPLDSVARAFERAGAAKGEGGREHRGGRSKTLVLFAATAGMRLVSPHQERIIMDAARVALRGGTGTTYNAEISSTTTSSSWSFSLGGEAGAGSPEWTRVIDGWTEASYDWLTVTGALGLPLLDPKTSRGELRQQGGIRGVPEGEENEGGTVGSAAEVVGALDLGGASTQIAYFEDDGRTTVGGERRWRQRGRRRQGERRSGASSFVGVSHLGYGALDAFDKAMDICAETVPQTMVAVGPHADGNYRNATTMMRHPCPCLSVGQEQQWVVAVDTVRGGNGRYSKGIVILVGTGDADACRRSVTALIVKAGISRSPVALATWNKEGCGEKQQQSNNKRGNKRAKNADADAHAVATSKIGLSGPAAAITTLHQSSSMSANDGVNWDGAIFFAFDFFATMGNLLLEELLRPPCEALHEKFEQSGQSAFFYDIDPSTLVVGGALVWGGKKKGKVEEEGVRPPTMPAFAVHANGTYEGPLMELAAEPGRQRRSSFYGPLLGEGLGRLPIVSVASSSSSPLSPQLLFAAPTGRQLAHGARAVCAQDFGSLSARLLAAGKNPLKVERACFGGAYVISLLEAYGLIDGATFLETSEHKAADSAVDESSCSRMSPSPSAPPLASLSAQFTADCLSDGELLAAASTSPPSPPAHVVFADSFGPFEASWALGALVSRLMATGDRGRG